MSTIRITGGALARRRLQVPARGVRPTSDRVREALFSSLTPHLAGARVLDLFAGTGALGLEALSRGAASVAFVERAAPSVQALRANLASVAPEAVVEVIVADARRAIARFDEGAFDLVFVDPPYKDPVDDELCAHLRRVVSEGGRVVVERDRRSPPIAIEGMRSLRERRYGDTRVDVFETHLESP